MTVPTPYRLPPSLHGAISANINISTYAVISCREADRPWPDTLITFFPFRREPGEPAQGVGHLHAPADAGDHHVDHGKGRVEVAARVELLDRHARCGQRLRVSDTPVAQRIELAGHYECLGQARQFAAQWRGARIGS